MKKMLYKTFGCAAAGVSGLFLISSVLCFIFGLTGGISYPSMGTRFANCALYLIFAVIFFQGMRFGLRLFRKGRGETKTGRKTEGAEPKTAERVLDDISYIGEMHRESQGAWQVYTVRLAARPYGWEGMIDWADYTAGKELTHVDQVTVNWNAGSPETNLTEAYRKHGSVKGMAELEREGSSLSVAGASSTLHTMMKISWYNQTPMLRLYTTVKDEEQMRRYVETLVRRTFGTDQAMALARPVPAAAVPVTVNGNRIDLNEAEITEYLRNAREPYELGGVMKLKEKTPTVILSENGHEVQEYVLETAEGEDFTGQYFHYSVRINPMGNPPVPGIQIDGFIAGSAEESEIGRNVGYRFEGYYPQFGGMACEIRRKAQTGRDLYEKGLRFPGYITPGNIRLVGVCSGCGKSLTFRGFNYPMMQADPLYSDDGLHVTECYEADFDKENGTVEKDGRIYRYYNSFRCRHCGTPYIDYAAHHEMKKFGILGCSYEL